LTLLRFKTTFKLWPAEFCTRVTPSVFVFMTSTSFPLKHTHTRARAHACNSRTHDQNYNHAIMQYSCIPIKNNDLCMATALHPQPGCLPCRTGIPWLDL